MGNLLARDWGQRNGFHHVRQAESKLIPLPRFLCHFNNARGPRVFVKLLVEVFQLLFQFRDDFRVFGSQVVLFTDVGAEMVENRRGF